MATMKDIITSPLLLAMVIIGLLYIVGFSLVYLKKAYTHCLELGIPKEDLKNVIKSSLVFSIVPSLSIVVGLFALISVLGTVWSWWRLSVIGSLSYESLISSSVASAIGFSSSAEMLEGATGQQFGVVMILMSIGMLSGFFHFTAAWQKAFHECQQIRRKWKRLEVRFKRLFHAVSFCRLHSGFINRRHRSGGCYADRSCHCRRAGASCKEPEACMAQ